MSYFILEIHEAYTPPKLIKWHGILDPKTLHEKKRNLIPKYTIYHITPHIQTVFTDLILHPCFMVSEKMMETIKLYDPYLHFERIVLADQATKKVCIYYIPILEKLDILTDKSTLENIEIAGGKIKGRAIFQIEHHGKVDVIAHLDLVESLLRRKVIGIELKAIDIKGE